MTFLSSFHLYCDYASTTFGTDESKYILQSTKAVNVDQIKAVFPNAHKEITEETYDIYLLPPGEDPEACQSYLRMRNKDGKYTLMFEVTNKFLVYMLNISVSNSWATCHLVLSLSDGKLA